MYRTKVRTIEAFRWQGQPREEWPAWAQRPEWLYPNGTTVLTAYTQNGPVRVLLGNWCILGDGEIYPCTNEEFQKRYYEVNSGITIEGEDR